ncbi:MAG TPA: tRNA pseudouridine(55) synthase TruB [Spirochaetia bacterium]|nr:tRNA pseudouridine(55) synthase TruB [Spirochaetia bacterium]
MSSVDGFLLLRKPTDVTSFQALTPIKRLFPGTKVGHTGTLDRFAEGLLVVLCGRMTRLTPLLTGLDKEYVGEIFFGRETDTLDPEGEVTCEGPIPSREQVIRAIDNFVGEIEQIPPQYSAIHVAGERAYRAARAGRTVAIAARTVKIDAIELFDYDPPVAKVRVECSSGTYVRALARDIGRAAGSCAFLSSLLRTRVGPFALENAARPEGLTGASDLLTWTDCLGRLPQIAQLRAKEAAVARILAGGRISDLDLDPTPPDGKAAIYGPKGEFLALTERRNGEYRYELVASPTRD